MISEELIRIQTAKSNIKAAIEAKGVSIPSTATIDTYPTYVQEIPQGGGGGSADAFRITNRTATAGTITIAPATGTPDPIVFKTSTDGENWTTHAVSASTGITLPANGYVMIDASESPNPIGGYNTGNTWGMAADVEHNVSGKISSLAPKTPKGFIFSHLFTVNRYTNDKKLIDASGLILDFEYLNGYMYHWMFYGCSGLIAAPALPSTHLNGNCYQYMFGNCGSLTTAPALPATTIADSCYYSMFNGCGSLTTAPVLSATTVGINSYREMFKNCYSLSSITCFATSLAGYATTNWVNGINTQGVLYCASGATGLWTQGNDGYPSTWELKVYGEEPASDRTLEITDIPTPPSPYDGEDPYTKIFVDDGENYAEFGIVYDWSNYQYVISTSIVDGNSDPVTGFTTAFTNSALTIDGPWGDEVNISYEFKDSDEFGNCLHVGDDSATTTEYFDDGETAVSSITLTFPSLEVDAECQCGKTGGEWDYDNDVCLHPTGLLIKLTSIPDDGDSHTVTVTDGDGRECTLTMDMSDYSYTDSYDSEDKYSGYMEVDDLANGNAEWMIEGNMYGTYTIDVDGFTLPSEPDYDGSGNFVVVNYDFSQVDSMDDYCSRDAYDCENGGGTYDCQTGECSGGV